MKTCLFPSALIGRGIPSFFQSQQRVRILLGFLVGSVGFASQLQAQNHEVTNRPVEVITVRAADAYASEPCVTAVIDNGVFVISRSTYTNFDQTVFFELSGTAGKEDYDMVPGTRETVVIPAGRRAVELRVRGLADWRAEGPESVVLRILPPMCIAIHPPPLDCYHVGQPAEATIYIRDCGLMTNSPPFVKILKPLEGQVFQAPVNIPIIARTIDPDGYCSIAEFFAGEKSIGTSTVAFLVAPTNGTPVDFEFVWKNAPVGNHVLRVQARDQRGNVGRSDPVRIGVGPVLTNRPAEVSVIASEPLAIEGTNCWGWNSPTNRYPVGAAAEYTTAVVGSDRPVWWYTNCGPKNATFTIRRGGPTNEDLQVFFKLAGSAVNGLDYELLPNHAVIPAGSRKADVLVVPKLDPVIEPMETVVIELTPPPYANTSPLPPPYIIVPPARAAAAIVDSSRPRVIHGLLPDRSFHLGAHAPDGAWYRLERSTNLVHWETLCTNRVIQGELHFVDPDTDATHAGFYRALPAAAPDE